MCRQQMLTAVVLINAFLCQNILWAAGGDLKNMNSCLGPKINIVGIELQQEYEKIINEKGGLPEGQEVPVQQKNVMSLRDKIIFIVLHAAGSISGLFFLLETVLPSAADFSCYVLFLVGYLCGELWHAVGMYQMLNMKRAVLPPDTKIAKNYKISIATPMVPSSEVDWPDDPGQEPEFLVKKLKAMTTIKVPESAKLEAWVLDEENNPRVRELASKYGVKYFSRKGITKYNQQPHGRKFLPFQARQKTGNLNAWLDLIKQTPINYDIITFIDFDHVPTAEFYKQTLPYFENSEIDFVQGPEMFEGGKRNFVFRASQQERSVFYGHMMRSWFGLGAPFIQGSHTTFRANVFNEDELGRYPVHLSDDFLITLELRAKGKKGVYTDEIIAYGKNPDTWAEYIGREVRWAMGTFGLLLFYADGLLKNINLKEKIFYYLALMYYSWGLFFLIGKIAISSLLLSGAIVAFYSGWLFLFGISLLNLVVSLWQQKFFIAPEKQRALFIDRMFMDFFMAPYYVIALIKTIIKPNTPFRVTGKYREQGYQDNRFTRNFIPQWTYLFFDAAVLTIYAFLYGVAFSNLLVYPLIIFFLMNLYMLLTVSSKSVNGGKENPLFVRTIISIEDTLFNRTGSTGQIKQTDHAKSTIANRGQIEHKDPAQSTIANIAMPDLTVGTVQLRAHFEPGEMPEINPLELKMSLLPIEQAI